MKLRGGKDPGAAVEGVSRWSSANTCLGAQVTLAASHTSPELWVQSAAEEKSSVPSTTTGWPGAAIAVSTIGAPDIPESGGATCSR